MVTFRYIFYQTLESVRFVFLKQYKSCKFPMRSITSWFVLFFKQYKSCSFPKRFWLDMPGIWLDITWYDRNLTWHDRKLGNINRTRETDSSNQFRDPWIGLFIYMILKTMGGMVRLFLVMLFIFFFFYFILKCLKILSYF